MSFINTHQVISYLTYFRRAKTIYSVHSPFMFEIVSEILENKKDYYAFIDIEQSKRALSLDRHEIKLHDLGAGSKANQSNTKTVSDILNTSVSNDQKCKLLFHLSRVLQPETALELGTSLGISALSIVKGNPNMSLHTIEGDPGIREIAAFLFSQYENNIVSHCGSFEDILPVVLDSIGEIDFVFIDGNHRYEATIRYHNMIKPFLAKNAVIIYDDIYWSKGMTKAWQELVTDEDFQFSLDVFDFGVLFKRETKAKKQDFTIINSSKKPWKMGISG